MITTRRCKIEIYFDILRTIDEGNVIFTRIMYASNLSHKPLSEALDLLINKAKLIEFSLKAPKKQYKSRFLETINKRKGKEYKLTTLGKKRLTEWKEIVDTLKPDIDPLSLLNSES